MPISPCSLRTSRYRLCGDSSGSRWKVRDAASAMSLPEDTDSGAYDVPEQREVLQPDAGDRVVGPHARRGPPQPVPVGDRLVRRRRDAADPVGEGGRADAEPADEDRASAASATADLEGQRPAGGDRGGRDRDRGGDPAAPAERERHRHHQRGRAGQHQHPAPAAQRQPEGQRQHDAEADDLRHAHHVGGAERADRADVLAAERGPGAGQVCQHGADRALDQAHRDRGPADQRDVPAIPDRRGHRDRDQHEQLAVPDEAGHARGPDPATRPSPPRARASTRANGGQAPVGQRPLAGDHPQRDRTDQRERAHVGRRDVHGGRRRPSPAGHAGRDERRRDQHARPADQGMGQPHDRGQRGQQHLGRHQRTRGRRHRPRPHRGGRRGRGRRRAGGDRHGASPGCRPIGAGSGSTAGRGRGMQRRRPSGA